MLCKTFATEFPVFANIDKNKENMTKIENLYNKNLKEIETIQNLDSMFKLYGEMLSSIVNEKLKKDLFETFNQLKIKLDALKILHNKIIYEYINDLTKFIFKDALRVNLFKDTELGSTNVGKIFKLYNEKDENNYNYVNEMYKLCEDMVKLLKDKDLKDEDLKKKSLELLTKLQKIIIPVVSDGKRKSMKRSTRKSNKRSNKISMKRSMKRRSIKRSMKRRSIKRSSKRRSMKRSMKRSTKRKSIKRRSNKRKSIRR